MFKSQLTGKQYPAHVSPIRVVVETRDVVYVHEDGYGRHYESNGIEIVKELVIGPDELSLI